MMKVFKNNYFLGGVLSILLIIWFVSVTSWKTTIFTTPQSPEHEAWLHSLFLSGQDDSWLRVSTGNKNLDILNWLIVWISNDLWDGEFSWVLIGWGNINKISKSNGGIGWWGNNDMMWENWAIAWWESNRVEWDMWVVGWWYGSHVRNLWVVVWWRANRLLGSRGIILWGYYNVGWSDSFVLWTNATWNENSFAWSAEAPKDSARIDTDNWVLIWTRQAITWVKLVVDGAIKLWTGGNNVTWAIRLTNKPIWIIAMYDGYYSRVLGYTGSAFDDACGCKFGWVELEPGDMIRVYSKSYATNCELIATTGQCLSNWQLSPMGYPYCYEISSDPRWKGRPLPGWWGWTVVWWWTHTFEWWGELFYSEDYDLREEYMATALYEH